jgi:hypothetical protein
LLGEQIAGAMLDAAKLKPSLILTNCEATLHADRESIRPWPCYLEIAAQPVNLRSESC